MLSHARATCSASLLQAFLYGFTHGRPDLIWVRDAGINRAIEHTFIDQRSAVAFFVADVPLARLLEGVQLSHALLDFRVSQIIAHSLEQALIRCPSVVPGARHSNALVIPADVPSSAMNRIAKFFMRA
jgi:hypothetical protein